MIAMSSSSSATMVDRVQRTLLRLGLQDCIVREIRGTQITLFCPSADRNDHSMIQVAVRLLPGIKSVVIATDSQKEDRS